MGARNIPQSILSFEGPENLRRFKPKKAKFHGHSLQEDRLAEKTRSLPPFEPGSYLSQAHAIRAQRRLRRAQARNLRLGFERDDVPTHIRVNYLTAMGA